MKQNNKKPWRILTLGISGEEKNYFIENLELLVSSGIGIIRALDGIAQEVKSRKIKKIIEIVRLEVEGGSPLWKAIDRAGLFSAQTIALIKIGEEAGRLSENFKVISSQQQKERIFRSRIYSAMMYPALILILTIAIGAGIAWFLLPRLSFVFLSLDLELPFLTRVLITAGQFMGEYGIIVMPVFFVLFFIFIIIFFVSPKTRFLGEAILFAIPGVKKLIQEAELARFGFVFGTLIEAGLPVLDAIDSLRQSTVTRVYRNLHDYLYIKFEEGNSFEKSFKGYWRIKKLIPIPIQQMIISAEQSGRLSETLVKIGKIFETKTEITTKNLSVILEPVLLIIVWLGVLFVALAVVLPIYSLVGGLR